MSPSAIAVDYLTGNLFVTAVADDEVNGFLSRKRRMSQSQVMATGAVFVAKSDGRYLKRIVDGLLELPTSIVSLPTIGRICYSDAGITAKIECADMDGNHREVIVSELIFSPLSLTVDEAKENRLYWADPKYHKIDSCLPDGSKRMTVVHNNRVPWAVDVFENNLYWISKETLTLYVQDKFGRGRVHVLASNLRDPHTIRIQQRFARDASRAVSACEQATCSHLCVSLPNHAYICLCPDHSVSLDDGSCPEAKIDALPLPKQCDCQNGRVCRLDGTCDCGEFEGDLCQKPSTVSRQLIGRFGTNWILALLLIGSLLACLVLIVVIAVNLHRKRMLLFKKNEAADGSVAFHGNVISFSNPTLDHKNVTDVTSVEYCMSNLKNEQLASSTTFSNPVYEMEDSPESPSTSTEDPKSRETASLSSPDSPPPSSASVIAPKSDLLRPGVLQKKGMKESDKAQLVNSDQVTDV
ncbi:hypothetical protein AB6A40_009202 [Gnathostoma spinigerum]|uniref:Vitellogenin receptor n=1 Tax=Gnathostoma spinigerum TaxID=75299 RepID=A0ABD6ERB4_9BILA